MKKMNNKGFSLVELIIVIAIMAVLIGVLAPQFIKYVERSRESTDLQNVDEVKTAVETYVSDHGEDPSLPTSITVILAPAPGDIKYQFDGADSTALEEYGIKTSNKTKSAKWAATYTYTYETTGTNAYKWQIPTGNAVYFNLDGTVHS